MKKKTFKKVIKNGCECWHCGSYRIIKQRNADIYNLYKAEKPIKEGEPETFFSSVHKVVKRVETHIDEETGEEVKTNVMGAKEYITLEAAMADCKK